MRTPILIFATLLIQTWVHAKDAKTTHFVKSFIENEQKPTHLVYKLCWKKNREINLVNEVAKIGVGSSSVLSPFKYQHHVLILLDLDCLHSEDFLVNAASENQLRAPYRWLIISSSDHRKLSQVLASPFLKDSDAVLAERSEQGFRLTELHKSSSDDPMYFSPRGLYNGTLLDTRPHKELFRRRRDLMGHPLIMSNVIQDTNSTKYHLLQEDRLEPEYDSIPKFCWSNVKLGLEMLNATPVCAFAYRMGYKHNGQWSGMINDLRTGRADVGTGVLISTQRLDVVDYTHLSAPFKVGFVFRQPPLSYVSNIFYLPFSVGVWIAMVVCVVVSTATLYVTSKHEARFGKSATQLDGNIGDALILTMSAVSQQGCVLEPKKASGRVIVWVLFTALMALYAAYSANIMVLLQAPSSSIETLAQLAHSKIPLAALDVDYNHFVFKMYNDSVRVEINKMIEPEKGKKQFYDLNEGVEMIRQGLFAFHAIVDPIYRRIEKTFLEMEKCDLMEVRYLNSYDPLIPVTKNSPFLELLRVVFMQIREAGIYSALVKRHVVPKPRCSANSAAFSSVGLIDLKSVMFLMLYGIAASIIILLIEILVFKFGRPALRPRK